MIRSIFSSLSSLLSAPSPDRSWRTWNAQLRSLRHIQASYEASLPRDDLWTLADFKDADAALLPEVRRQIRSRARYERANNTLIDRVVNVWAGDVVGECGPWLQVQSGDLRIDRFIEQAWQRWWNAAGMTAKLHTAVEAEAVDGEACGVLMHNFRLLSDLPPAMAVTLDISLMESDRLASPNFEDANRSDYIDGIHLDPDTRLPVAYDLLKAHPGTEYLDKATEMFEAETFGADSFLHAFRQNRAEQHRGISRYVSALPVAGHLRKYCEAEVTRAQIVAAFAFIIKSMVPPEDEGGEGNEDQWWQTLSLLNRQGIGTMLPEGYDITQLKADGAAGNLDVMNKLIAGHVSGCFTMPVGHALGIYGTSGYAPIRAEMLPYHKAITTARTTVWDRLWLKPLYRAFVFQLQMTHGWRELMDGNRASGAGDRENSNPEHRTPNLDLHNVQWKWPGRELIVDPSREEESRRKKLSMGLISREDEVDTNDLDEHDRRCARALGLGDDDAAVQKFRRMCGASIHQIPQVPGDGGQGPEEDATKERDSENEDDDGPKVDRLNN